MKNTLLALAFVLAAAFTAQAQDTASDFKPLPGDNSIEAGASWQEFQNGGTLKYRRFTSPEKAFRLSASLQYYHDSPSDEVTYSYSAISIAPGFERHFAGTSRLSPYLGMELPLSVAFSKYDDPETTIKGAWEPEGTNRAYIGAGLNAFAGVDFYVVKNFFVGLEFGAGLAYKKQKDIEVDRKYNAFDDYSIKGGSNISFRTHANSGFRIGFVF